MVCVALSVAASLALQAPLVVLDVARETRAPAAVSCGLVDAPLRAGETWRPVRLRGRGLLAPGVLVREPLGTAVRVLLPRGVPRGAFALTVEKSAASSLPAARLAVLPDGAVWETAGLRAAFEPGARVDLGHVTCRLYPPASLEGAWTVRSRDPMRVVLAFGDGTARPPLVLLAALHAGVPAVSLSLVVRGEAGVSPAALGLEILPAGAPEPAELPVAEPADAEAPAAEPPPEPALDAVLEDLRWSPWDAVPVAGGATASVRRHGPAAPRAVERSGDRVRILAIEPWEALASGEERALLVEIGDGNGAGVIARPGAFPSRVRLLARCAPAGACRELARLRTKLDAALGAFRADPRHGLLHRPPDLGDWKMDGSRVGNLEWDTALGFLVRFFETGDRLDAAQAAAGVEHLLLRDRDPGSGLFFQHGAEHRSGVTEPGHHWAEGAVLVASWLSDPWLLDGARRLAEDQVAAFAKLDAASALPRSLGWALTALAAGHELAPAREKSLAAIARLEDAILSRQSDAGHFQIERSTARDGAWRVSPFVDAGILFPGLEKAAAVTREPRTGEALRRARSALVRDAIVTDPDGPHLASSVLIEPRSGRVAARGGRAEGEEIALFLSGLGPADAGRAWDALLARAAESLALDERIYLGKGISMLMRALPACAARRRGR
jgi:hypothetical protein